MDLPTYTNIWRIEKRLYKLYDFRLPMPLPVGQIAVFMVIAVPYILILSLLGLPFSHTLVWVYVLPPGVLAWLTTRPVLEGKRLPELITSQVRYLLEPRTWARMSPLTEKDDVIIFCRVWRAAAVPAAEAAIAETPQAAEPLPALTAGSAAAAGSVAAAGKAAMAGRAVRPAMRRPVRQQRPAPRPLALPARSGRPRTQTSGPVGSEATDVSPAASDAAAASAAAVPGEANSGQAISGTAIAGQAIAGQASAGPFRTHAPGAAAASAGAVPGQAGPGPLRTHAPGAAGPSAAAAASQVTPGPLPRREPTRGRPGQAHPAAARRPMMQEPAVSGPAAVGPAARPVTSSAAASGPAGPGRPVPGHVGPGWPVQDPIAGPAAHGPGAHGPGAHGLGAHGPAAHGPAAHGSAADAEQAAGPGSGGHGHLGPGWPVQDPADPTRVAAGAAEAVPATAPDRSIPVPPARPAADRVAPGWPAHDPSAPARPGQDRVGPAHAGQRETGQRETGRQQAGPERSGAGWPVHDPSAPGSGQPGGTPQWLHPRRPEPEQAAPDQARPDLAAQARAARPEAALNESALSESARPESAQHESAQAEAVQAESVQHRVARAQAPQLQAQPQVAESQGAEPQVAQAQAQTPSTPVIHGQVIPPRQAEPPAAAGNTTPAERQASGAIPVGEEQADTRTDAEESNAEERGTGTNEPGQRPARPVVRVTGDHHPERPLRVVERALRSQPGQRHDGWRERVVIVPGGHRPGKPDQLQRDRARARLPLSGPRRIVVLGCTRGAGQTMTALLAGDMLAALRAEPVAVLDLNPGRGSLTERAAEIPGLVQDPDAPVPVPGPGGRADQAALGLQVISGAAAARGGDEAGRILDLVATRYALTFADPAAGCVPRALEVADQLLIVAPASAEAANALAMTFEWLEAHGYRRLADGAITVINGVSRPTSAHAEHAASVATGRCRAIVKVPWDNQLKAMSASRVPPAQAGAATAAPGRSGPDLAAPVDPRGASALSPALSHAYTALAGVLIASLADPDELRSARG